MADASHVKALIVDSLRKILDGIGIDSESIPDDFDLRARGIVDSLAFVQLLANLEARLGCAVDLSEVEPEQLTKIGVLAHYIAAQSGFQNAR